jgi:hypothetical protein
MLQKALKTCRIFAKIIRKRREFTAKLWLEQGFNNNTETRKPESKQQGRKTADRLEMSVRNSTTMTY